MKRLCSGLQTMLAHSLSIMELTPSRPGAEGVFRLFRAFSTSSTVTSMCLTRAPLGYFYNAPHWGGGYFEPPPPLISETTGPILKIQAAFESPEKNCRRKTNFIDLGVTSDVTGQVKVKMFDISGLVTSASKIAMLSTNKAN